MALLSIGHVSSVAKLRTVKTVPAPEEFSVAFVFGIQDLVVWDDSSEASDDGVSTFKPADRTGAGRWVVAAGGGISENAARLSYFGSGLDADPALDSGTTTLTRSMVYESLTLTNTAILNPDGGVIRVKNRLKLNGCTGGIRRLQRNGNAGAAGGAGGAASAALPLAAKVLPDGFSSIVGGAGGVAAGTQAGAASAQTGFGGVGGTSPTAGSGSGGAGAAGRAGGVLTKVFDQLHNLLAAPAQAITNAASNTSLFALTGTAGGSGGGGGGDGTAGGGGGSGGGPGSALWIFAREIEIDALTGAAVIQALGGNGGNGGTPAAGNRGGGAPGGGGGGGVIVIVYETMIGPLLAGAVDASGGIGGTGGSGTGTGTGANGAAGGEGGVIVLHNISTGVTTYVSGSAGTAGSAAAGTVGGAGGAGGPCIATLGAAA